MIEPNCEGCVRAAPLEQQGSARCCEDENFRVMHDTRASRSGHGGLMSYTYGEAPAATSCLCAVHLTADTLLCCGWPGFPDLFAMDDEEEC